MEVVFDVCSRLFRAISRARFVIVVSLVLDGFRKAEPSFPANRPRLIVIFENSILRKCQVFVHGILTQFGHESSCFRRLIFVFCFFRHRISDGVFFWIFWCSLYCSLLWCIFQLPLIKGFLTTGTLTFYFAFAQCHKSRKIAFFYKFQSSSTSSGNMINRI